jgi:serine/threonine protein kinase
MPNPHGNSRYTFGSGAQPLDGYTIKRAIGRGGFGEVYYATSDAGKEVALKLVLKNLEVERRGVVQCMNLKCPNLVTVYDIRSNDADETFVIMEYISGPSLANVLAQYRHGLPPAEALTWLKGLVEGVAYLHDHGIVHRDLKPANLFMEEGIVKIGDYGLAKLIAPGQGGTEHSESIGTCHYMAPEIASGKYNKPIDVYAIGVIMYEMLTGKVPFDGESVGEVLMKHLTARPDVSGIPEPFRTIVARALSKDPNHRPARVQDLLPPSLAPRAQDVRFIGDGKNGGPGLKAPEPPKGGRGNGKAPKEDILVIGEEEPVFYIGPNTRPSREAISARSVGPRSRRPHQRPRRLRLLLSLPSCRVRAFAWQNSPRRCFGPHPWWGC